MISKILRDTWRGRSEPNIPRYMKGVGSAHDPFALKVRELDTVYVLSPRFLGITDKNI